MAAFPETQTICDRARGDAFLSVIAKYTDPPKFKCHNPTEGREFATRCPLGCGSQHDALTLWPDRLPRPRWYCRRCERSGDVFAFVMAAEGLSFKQTVNRVSDYLNMPVTPRPYRPLAATADLSGAFVDINMNAWQLAAGLFTKACADRIMDKVIGKPYREFLYSRGITDSTIRRARLGCLNEPIDQLPDKWGIDQSKTIKPGLIIPHLDSGGTVTAIKIRTGDPKLKYCEVYRGGGIIPPYGSPTLRPGGIGILQESEIDAQLGMQYAPEYGWLALPAGQKLRPSAIPPDVTLIIALDTDPAGRNATAKLLETWPDAIVAPPFGDGAKDLSELYQARGPEAVTAWIDATIDAAVESVAF